MPEKLRVAVVGGGILGLAHAWTAARRGHSVTVFERSLAASGASIRNFGMIWPIGQPTGEMHQIALRSREIWQEVLNAASLPYYATGSLHAAYENDEADLLREFAEIGPVSGYACEWLSASSILDRSGALQPDGLKGGLWSATELTVDPRVTIARLPEFLREARVTLRFGQTVTRIDLPRNRDRLRQ
jgi:FAD dependent oxidoreductase TIGR03364